MSDLIDLDLTPWAPRRFKVKGASGRMLTCEEWMPVDIFLRHMQRFAELKNLTSDDFFEKPELYTDTLGEVQQLALTVLKHSEPSLTIEDIREEMPGEAVMTFLAFLSERYFNALRARKTASQPEKEPVETQTPSNTSALSAEVTSTGSMWSPISSNEAPVP